MSEKAELSSHLFPTKQHSHAIPKTILTINEVNGLKTETETPYHLKKNLVKNNTPQYTLAFYLCEPAYNQTFFGLIILPTLAFQIPMDFSHTFTHMPKAG